MIRATTTCTSFSPPSWSTSSPRCSQIGAIHLAASFVADLQLIAAACVWGYVVYITGAGLDPGSTASIVSLAAGALAANILSVILLVIETVMFHR